MIDVTKDELYGTRYKEPTKWRNKESNWLIFTRVVMKHKIITVITLCFGICMITNVILIYSFVKILGEM